MIMPKIFFISDLHLNHANIIKYYNRPFFSVKEMNETITRNWNNTVGEQDLVFHLGDFCFNGNNPYDFIKQLNGHIVFIKGNNDNALIRSGVKPLYDTRVFHNRSEDILLIHDPGKVLNWNDWIIHGHHHNHLMYKYPLINNKRKTINVSVELLNYTPIGANKLLSMRCFKNVQ
jgi:calcineurin-like phosphoesterase family protein